MSSKPAVAGRDPASIDVLPDASSPKIQGTKQARSMLKRAAIGNAARAVLASHGVAGITHRLVAREAGVSLAATTYYFGTKFDIIAEASSVSLQNYVDSFHRAAVRFRDGVQRPSFRDFTLRLVHNAAERDRAGFMSWAEIILDARRHPESLALSQIWFARLTEIWREIAEVVGVSEPDGAARSAIDAVVGLQLMTVSLGLTNADVDAVFDQGRDPLEAWRIDEPAPKAAILGRSSQKSFETSENILAAAIQILVSEGPGAVTYKAIAMKAGLTPAAPFYHFPTIAGLLAEAQRRLFEQSKERYRAGASRPTGLAMSEEHLVDRTTIVFLREATEFAGSSSASYAVWLQGARQPELRPMIWRAISDQGRAWRRVLERIGAEPRPVDALLAQCVFVGKLLRILATGSTTGDLALVRGEFARDIHALRTGTFFI